METNNNDNIEATIVEVADLLKETMEIPSYQRPYKWSEKSIFRLFFDIKDAMDTKMLEYRLGSIILHKDESEGSKFFIVDGQQRYISLLLLLGCLNYEKKSLKISHELSKTNICINFKIFSKLVNLLKDKEKYKNYLLNNCSFVKITVKEESQAFQMFDSQNSRGKSLKPHDLLKAYHLRKMYDDKVSNKTIKKLTQKWQEIKENDLANLFGIYLFQIKNWIKRRRDDYFNSEKIDIFKGIDLKNKYNYVLYHKSSNIFQLDQPIIAGTLFFKNILYYNDLLKKVQNKINSEFEDVSNDGERLKNARLLLERIALLYCDRFDKNLTLEYERVFKAMFVWAYTPYIALDAPTWKTYHKFAVGEHYDLNNNIPLFFEICEFKKPEDFIKLNFQNIKDRKSKKIKEKYKTIYGIFNSFFGDINNAQ